MYRLYQLCESFNGPLNAPVKRSKHAQDHWSSKSTIVLTIYCRIHAVVLLCISPFTVHYLFIASSLQPALRQATFVQFFEWRRVNGCCLLHHRFSSLVRNLPCIAIISFQADRGLKRKT